MDHTSHDFDEYPYYVANWCYGPLNPGVPDGKYEISSLLYLIVVKSVNLIYYNWFYVLVHRILSTLISLFVISWSWRYFTTEHTCANIILVISYN
jgi:hypothetical protein